MARLEIAVCKRVGGRPPRAPAPLAAPRAALLLAGCLAISLLPCQGTQAASVTPNRHKGSIHHIKPVSGDITTRQFTLDSQKDSNLNTEPTTYDADIKYKLHNRGTNKQKVNNEKRPTSKRIQPHNWFKAVSNLERNFDDFRNHVDDKRQINIKHSTLFPLDPNEVLVVGSEEINKSARGMGRLNHSPYTRSRVKDNNYNEMKPAGRKQDVFSINETKLSSTHSGPFVYSAPRNISIHNGKSDSILSKNLVKKSAQPKRRSLRFRRIFSLNESNITRTAVSKFDNNVLIRKLRDVRGQVYYPENTDSKYFKKIRHFSHKHGQAAHRRQSSHPVVLPADRRKRYSYVDRDGLVRYGYVTLPECCDYPSVPCDYPAYLPPVLQPRPSYGPRNRHWKGLRHGCNCNEFGSEIKSCDIKTGQCRCRPRVHGTSCDRCEVGYWGLKSGRGCSPCACDALGSEGGACDADTGECRCRPGVGGAACDVCLPDHYGFGETGCLKCEVCGPGQICDPDTGRCICPPLAQGPTCKECRPGAWGLVPLKGCKYCNCSGPGSTHSQCSPYDGHCACREGFAGPRCDTCSPLHFGYPRCRPCACHHPGTRPEACDQNNRCQCDSFGQCPCKANVVGQKCNMCKEGTFGLSTDIPSGCTHCFCFGRSDQCTQADLTWGQLRLNAPRSLTVRPLGRPKAFGPIINYITINKAGELPLDLYSEDQNLELNTTYGITRIPESEGNVTIGINSDLPYPLYWELPKKFLGDRVTSYGGYLKFTAESLGEAEPIPPLILKQYPLVQILAQGVLVLEYYEKHPSPIGNHEVWFHESKWTLQSPQAVTALSTGSQIDRALLMVALQNVDAVYLRATHYTLPSEAILSEVVMDRAIKIQGHPMPLANSVELCTCPFEYNSTSCQEAANGFYIPANHALPPPNQMSDITQIIGEAKACRCNGRSETCHKTTGHCTHCRENTGGRYCEQCAHGHYGSPEGEGGCQACPCPHTARNHAQSCHVRPGRVMCNCKPGYTGEDCSECARGWWLGEDGRCRQCECGGSGVIRDSSGVVPDCHPTTGQCPCRPHVTGMRCDICITPRHVLEESACIPCDNCSQTLLDTVELMSYELVKDTEHIKNTSIPLPWIPMYEMGNRSLSVKDKLESMIQAIKTFQSHPRNAFVDLSEDSKSLLKTSERVNNQLKEVKDKSCSLKEDAELIFDNLMEIRKRLEDKTRELEDFGRHDRHLNVNKVLKEAKNIIKKIKAINLTDHLSNADKIFDKANLQSAIIYEYIYKINDHENKINELNSRFDAWHNKTDDINEFKEQTWDIVDGVTESVRNFRDRINDVIEKNVQSEAIYGDILKLQDHHLNQKSMVILQECEDDILHLNTIRPVLGTLTGMSEEKEGILYRVNPDYEEDYLRPAQSHADNLTAFAKAYKNSFSATKVSADSALSASSAYRNIIDKITASKETALEALEEAELAKEITAGRDFPESYVGEDVSLLKTSKTAKILSNKQLNKAKHQYNRLKELRSGLDKPEQNIERIKVTIRGIAWKDKEINMMASNLSAAINDDNLVIANNKSDRVIGSMGALYQEADVIHKDTLYKLKMKLQELRNHGDDKIGGAEEQISLLRGNIKRSSELVSSLKAAIQLREAEVKKSNATLTEKLQLLREKIQRAKHAADGIRISMQSTPGGHCFRSYRLAALSPSTTTRLSATLSLSPDSIQDFVIFHLPSSIRGDFVKLELINRRIRFSWNLGGDTAYITHPEKLHPYSANSDYSGYRVDADRVWNMGKLWVQKVDSLSESSASPLVPATNSSNPAFGILEVKPDDLAWIGNIGTQSQDPAGISGCIHQVTFNGRPVGLWNFHSQPNTNQCQGCLKGSSESQIPEGNNIFYWEGTGYSVLKRSDLRPYNKYKFSIVLKFRTFDENALLFLAVDEANNRSVSLQLREGRVVFRIDYAGESRLEINTTEKYNTGKMVQVEAARVFIKRKIEKGSLKVDGYEQLGSPNPPVINAEALPDLINSQFLLGGTPPLWKPSPIIHSLPPAFLGCLGDVTIDQEGYNPLETDTYYGIESSCSQKPLTTVGFYGDGFLEMPAFTLRKKSTLGFMFRTLQPNAFLMLSAPPHYHITRNNDVMPDYLFTTQPEFPDDDFVASNDGFYSFSLVGGNVHLLMNAGKGDLKLISNLTLLNDGLFHAVSILKTGRRVELFVDDVIQSSGTLPPGSVVVHGRPQIGEGNSKGGLFLGGVPENLNETEVTDQHIASTISLRGAIKDIVFDGKLIPMQEVVDMNHALIGRMGPPMGEEFIMGANLLNMQETESDKNKTLKGCHKVYSYTLEPGAVKFGDVSNSYARVQLTGRNIWQRDFLLELDFRTFYPNGLLFATPGSKEKVRHSIAVFLRDGKVTVSVKARRKRGNELILPLITNDGIWHHVIVRSSQRKLSLTVGPKNAVTRFPKKIFLSNTLYVGGLPDKSSLLMIPEYISKIEGFKGCIRRLTVNGKLEDLVKDGALHQNVGQCFPTIEKGSYFPGDAYAIYKRQFVIGSLLELQLEFRTVEMNAILLNIAHPQMKAPALSLEILNAKVVMSVLTESGRRFRVETGLPAPYGLCDNTWHNISVLFSDDELTVRVDQQPERTDVNSGPLVAPPSINQPLLQSPLYIGGLPDGAPTGILTTKDNFKGCIRNVGIGGQRKDWIDMDYLHNLLLSSCPVQ